MIKRIIASVVIFLTLSSSCVYAVDFSYSASIENFGSKKYKAVKLTPEIYNNTTENLADLEIFDNNKEPIPYFINSFAESDTEIKINYEMKNIDSFTKDEFFYYDYTLKKPLDQDVIATSIELQTEKEDFAKRVEIWAGYDNINWEKVQEDVIYNVGGNKKLEITFDGIKKYTYYRFKIPNNLEKISFTSVTLKYNMTLQKKEYFTDTITPNFTTEERGKTTVIKTQSFKNLKLNSITLKTDSKFKRNVSFNGIESKMLYNLEFEGIKYRDLTIVLALNKVTADSSEIIIDNKDDKPIKILGIEAEYIVDELVFEDSKSHEYTLWYGNSEIKTPKNYDISNYSEQIINEGYDLLSIKETKVEASKDPVKQQYYYKLIFNIAVLVVAVILGLIIFRKLKK